MSANEIQQQLFTAIKRRLPADTSTAEAIAQLLNISTDSAYRRMRGEKQITLDELHVLCSTYKISVDQLMDIQTGALLFQGNFLDNTTFRFDHYLTGIINQLAYINSFRHKEFYYLCKESPLFHYYHCSELAAFKYYVWMGTLMHFPEFKNRKVSFSQYPGELETLGRKILGLYNQIDSVEIWNIESLNSTIRQVEFYRDSNLFESDADIFKVYEALEKMMDHIEMQAELGYKFDFDDPDRKPLGKFHMYFNEVVIGDNDMLAIMDNSKAVFLAHTAMNYIMTRDIVFCEKFHNYLQNLMKSSTLISEVSEKERSKFFKIHRERIASRKSTLKV